MNEWTTDFTITRNMVFSLNDITGGVICKAFAYLEFIM